uniref:Uncharacterized protein n=1 Tax=Anopheles melas TaxID=34690 RepID=A0A182UDT5_9DIPT
MQRGFSDLGHRIKKRVTLSSIPPQYVGNSTGQPSDRGDVVIVVPNIDAEHLEPVGIEELASVCIDTEIEIEPGSPKTITESSTHPHRSNSVDAEGSRGSIRNARDLNSAANGDEPLKFSRHATRFQRSIEVE